MKKMLLSLITLGAIAIAGSHDMYPNSINVVVLGRDINSLGTHLGNSSMYGFRYNKNIYNSSELDIDTYQIAVDFGNADYVDGKDSTSQLRLGGNMIWSIDTMDNLSPYFLLGAGVSYLGNPKYDLSTMSLYSNIGLGADFMVRDNFSLTAEAKYIYYGTKKSTTNINFGVKFSFGND